MGSMSNFPSVLIAVDKFKGSLGGVELSQAIERGMRRELGEGFSARMCPIADGSDGTVDAALAGFTEIQREVTGPLSESVPARYAFETGSRTAVVEVAEACGLWRLAEAELDPMNATTFGVGELILDALDRGAQHLVVGLGGSATTDDGAGILQALGAKLYTSVDSNSHDDAVAREILHGGAALQDVVRVDLSEIDIRLKDLDVTVACDVRNPLLGVHGAAAVYGPQKGASEEQVLILDKALAHFAELVENASVSRETYSSLPGAGAAGGLGFACFVMGAKMRPGVEVCFELTGFHEALDGADVVITGEGGSLMPRL